MQRALILAGIILLVIGLAWPWLSKLPLGRLPGDLRFEREGFAFFLPLTSGVLISVAISLVVWWLRK